MGRILALAFTVAYLYICKTRCQSPLARSLLKVKTRIHSHRTALIELRNEQLISNDGVEKKLTPLNYDETFAYGCLHEIPVPNGTLDTTFTPQQEKMVLMEIYNQTGGHSWYRRTHWGNHSLPHCLWYGITCESSGRYVISIFLTKNNLVGTLTGNLWTFRNLQGLCIGNNDGLRGNIGRILSANMTTVLRLDLAFNRLSGQIPGEILVQMRSLVKIQLCCQLGGGLSGEIPKDIGNLTKLQVLSLGENRLHGSIPKSIGKLKNLWFLDLESATNLRSGFENLFNLSSLRFMHLSLGGLKGTLPDEFGLYFPEMIECLLPGNDFSGNIPSTLGNMTNLWHLNLANNDFSGTIPKSIGSIPMLQIVDLRGNRLTSLEKGIKFESQSLEVLILANNKKLSMRFDEFLETIGPINQSLRILNISLCQFHGIIPVELWDFQSLISADLSDNSLSGDLPSPSDNMLFLLALDVSTNNLSGQIPQTFAKLLALEILDVSMNPHMQHKDKRGILPNYMTVDFTTLTRRKSSDKFKCPNARLSYNNGLVILDPNYYGFRLCICDIGYYGSAKTCLVCMKGAVCKDQMPPAQYMVMNVGYWPSVRDQNVTRLIQCSRVLGTSSLVNTPCNPNGTCTCRLEWLTDRNNSEVRPLTVCRHSCLCSKGSKDRFCSHCEQRFYKQGIFCYPCPNTKTSVYILAALVVLTMVLLTLAFSVLYKKKRFLSIVFAFTQVILLAVLAMLSIIPGWLLELNVITLFVGLAGRGRAARGILKISVFYFQTLDALISSADIWPYELLEAQRYISNVFNLRFSGLACAIPPLFTPLGELLSFILLPIVCIVGIWLYYGLGSAVHKLRHSLDQRFPLRNSCLQLSILSLNLTYFPIVKKTASVLARCGEDNGYHYLQEAPWLECNGHTYTMLQVFGWLSLLLYVIGVPFGVFLPLLRTKASKRDQLNPQEQENLDSWLGSIYLPYKEAFRSYFEVLFLCRRMLIAFSLSFIPRVSAFQTIAVCFVLLASLCFQLVFRPFRDSYPNVALENSAEALVLLTLHFSFMNIRYASLNPDSSAPIVWMLVAINTVLLCGIVICIIVLLGRAHAAGVSPTHGVEVEGNAPVLEEDAVSSPLVCDQAEQYGTFDNAQN